eukprot:jgi/Hompol1/5644/HPOL_004597-RA
MAAITPEKVLFETKRPEELPLEWEEVEMDADSRMIDYKFPASFLNAKTIATSLTFAVGPKELKDFRMIERHYFRDRLLKSFDFNFGFCIPNTVNTWEHVYETVSDSFYFANGKLIMHNKATFTYE